MGRTGVPNIKVDGRNSDAGGGLRRLAGFYVFASPCVRNGLEWSHSAGGPLELCQVRRGWALSGISSATCPGVELIASGSARALLHCKSLTSVPPRMNEIEWFK